MAILGMRGSGSYNDSERPKNWRQGILFLFPNGDCPLTGILSKCREQPTDDPQYHWFEKGLPQQKARLHGAATATGAAPADNADIAAADATAVIALKLAPYTTTSAAATAETSIYKPGHILVNQATEELFLVQKKMSVGGVDYLVVLRDIGNKFASNPALTGDTTAGDDFEIVGTGFPEGAGIGQAIAYAPTLHFNFTQIFRTPLFMTRTARKTRLRYDSSGGYGEEKREKLQLHGIEMEKAFIWGERSQQTSLTNPDAPLDVTGTSQPLRTTRGIVNWLPTINTTATPSLHWDLGTANGGALTETLWDSWLAELFRYGSREKLVLCGSTFLSTLTQLAKNKATIEMVPTDQTYGMHLMRYLTPFGTVMLLNHPLMSNDSSWRKDAIGLDVNKLTFRYVDDTRLLRNRQSPGDDASKDEWLTEAGLEVHFPGIAPSTAGGDPSSPSTLATPGAHGRLKGISSYGG